MTYRGGERTEGEGNTRVRERKPGGLKQWLKKDQEVRRVKVKWTQKVSELPEHLNPNLDRRKDI